MKLISSVDTNVALEGCHVFKYSIYTALCSVCKSKAIGVTRLCKLFTTNVVFTRPFSSVNYGMVFKLQACVKRFLLQKI